jgi:DNA-directed RNA polymerase subunit RPC12/RpoP
MAHEAETKTCQNCKKDFTIEPKDFNFYEKIKVPPPTFCPECRLIRKLNFRNERFMYHNVCALCNKKIISIISKDSNVKVYCPDCW